MTPVTSTSGGAAAAVASFFEHPVSAIATNEARMIKDRRTCPNRGAPDWQEFRFLRTPKQDESGSTRMGKLLRGTSENMTLLLPNRRLTSEGRVTERLDKFEQGRTLSSVPGTHVLLSFLPESR